MYLAKISLKYIFYLCLHFITFETILKKVFEKPNLRFVINTRCRYPDCKIFRQDEGFGEPQVEGVSACPHGFKLDNIL